MKVHVLFFGLTRDLTGFDKEEAEVREGERLGDLLQRYENRFPPLRQMRGSLLAAVNQEFSERSRPLSDGDEVALLPPVSGGSDDVVYRLTRRVIATEELARELKAPQDGAVVVFEGIVRNLSHGRRTLYLEYEAYEPMALRKMEEIGRQAKRAFAVDRIAMVHRLGRLEIGETSVAVIVSAPHRRAAFEACQFAIDRLKEIVPIWKREYFEDGAVWAEGEGQTRVLVEERED